MRVRLGQIGLGALGRMHAVNTARHVGRADLVRVVDLDAEVAESVADECGADWSTAADDLFEDPEIAGVVIATPTSTHAELAIRAAENRKHIFLEKPISLDRESTLQVIDAAQANKVLLQVGFHRRFDSDWQAVKRRIDEGRVGQPYFLRVSQRDMATPPDASFLESAGSFFVDSNSHDFDTARWLVGEIAEVTAFSASLSSRVWADADDLDLAVIVLRFVNGALGVIDGSRVAGYGYEASVELLGAQSSARIDGGQSGSVTWLSTAQASTDVVRDHIERHRPAYIAEIDHFCECVSNGQQPAVGGDDALAALILATATHLSLESGATVSLTCEPTATGVDYAISGP